jgi:hypothetical protein
MIMQESAPELVFEDLEKVSTIMKLRFGRSSGLLFASTVIGLLQVGCGDDLGDPTGSTCPEDSALTYENFGAAFMETNCLSCHRAGGPESPTLSTLEQIRSNADEIDRAAASGPDTTNTYMPDGASVATAERKKLGEWLACGAP